MTLQNERPPPRRPEKLLSVWRLAAERLTAQLPWPVQKTIYDRYHWIDPAQEQYDPLTYQANRAAVRVNWLAITGEIPEPTADRILEELDNGRFHRFSEYARSHPHLFPE